MARRKSLDLPKENILDLDYLPLGEDTWNFLAGGPVMSDVALVPAAPVRTLVDMSVEERQALVAKYGPISARTARKLLVHDRAHGVSVKPDAITKAFDRCDALDGGK